MDTVVDVKIPDARVLDLDARRAEVAERVGVSKTSIRTVVMQLETLRRQGILVDLSIGGTSMFTRSTTWAELGIQEQDDDEPDIRKARFTKGQKYLIPEDQVKRLRSVETSMRAALDYYGQDVTGFRPYRWIPFTAYGDWRKRWFELTARFEEIKLDILDHYDEYVAQLRRDFELVARASFASIRKQGYEWVILNRKPYDEQGFIEIVIADALAKLPSREFIQQNLKADYIVAMVYGLEEVEADKARAERIERDRLMEREQSRNRRQHDDLENQALAERVRHSHKMNELAELEREAQINAMWQAEIEHAREQLGQMVSPFEEVFRNLRTRFAQDASEILESVKKNGFVKGKVAEKGRGLIELFEMWATHDDHELRARLIQLRNAIGPGAKERGDGPERSVEDIKSILEEIQDLAHSAAGDLQRGPSRFSMLE